MGRSDCGCCSNCGREGTITDDLCAEGAWCYACRNEAEDDTDRCSDPDGHEWSEGEPDRGGEGPIRCIHCGADGDA